MSIGENIRRIRKEQGLTQKELGERCGIADANIRKYESDRQIPKIQTIQKIAEALRVSPNSLYDGVIEISVNGTTRRTTPQYVIDAYGKRLQNVLDVKEITLETLSQKTGIPLKELHELLKGQKEAAPGMEKKIDTALRATPFNAAYLALHYDHYQLIRIGDTYFARDTAPDAPPFPFGDEELQQLAEDINEPYLKVIQTWAEARGYEYTDQGNRFCVKVGGNWYSFTGEDMDDMCHLIWPWLDKELQTKIKSKTSIISPYATQPRSGLTGTQAATDPTDDHTKEG